MVAKPKANIRKVSESAKKKFRGWGRQGREIIAKWLAAGEKSKAYPNYEIALGNRLVGQQFLFPRAWVNLVA